MVEPTEFGAQEEEGAGFTLSDVWGLLQMHRRVIVGGAAAGFIVAALATALMERQYAATSVVHLAPVAAKEVQLDGVQTDVTAAWNRKIDVATKLAVLESSALREKVVARYDALVDGGDGAPAVTPGMLRKAVEARERKGTELIDIAVQTDDPELSARLANLVADVFCDESMAGNIEAARSAREWLADQLEEYEQRIRDATIAKNAFERENGLAGSTTDGETSLASRMTSLNEAYGALATEVVIQETLVADYERLLREGRYQDIAKAIGESSPIVASLAERYATAAVERAEAEQIYLDKHPAYKKAQGQVELIERELRTEVGKVLSAERAKLEILRAKQESVVGAIGAGKDQLLGLQVLWGEYEHRRTELQNAKDFYQRLRARMGELELQSKTQFNRARVLEYATPPESPSFPIVWINLLIGLVLGLGGGFAVAFVREWLDDSVGSPVDVAAYLKVPFLGAVPKVLDEADEVGQALHTHLHPRSPVAESMRAVRTVLELNPLIDVPRRILVTSAMASEGKTSTAIRLAIAYVNAHRRVVVVDCDLRRPRVHKVFQGTRDLGVTTLLEGADVRALARETSVPNLFYVSSGRAGDRPDELLSAPTLGKVIDDLAEAFDIVIVDSPPTQVVADARLLSRYVDGVVFVARENSTPRSVLREAIVGMHQVGARVFGVVINAVDFSRQSTSYKYYNYGYHYTYQEDATESAAG